MSFSFCRDNDEEAQANSTAFLAHTEPPSSRESTGRPTGKRARRRRRGLERRTATGLVGSPETIAERIMAFHEAGVELFLLQFHPMLEEMERFASQVMPLLPLGEKAPEAAEA